MQFTDIKNKKDLEAYEYAKMREADEETREMFVEEKKAKKVAVNAIKKGLDNELISELTGLSIEQIEALRNETQE
jgi:hypothetical protein